VARLLVAVTLVRTVSGHALNLLLKAVDALIDPILFCVHLASVALHFIPKGGELVSNAGTNVADAEEGREGGKDDEGDGVEVDIHVSIVPSVWGVVKQSDWKNGKKFVSSYDM